MKYSLLIIIGMMQLLGSQQAPAQDAMVPAVINLLPESQVFEDVTGKMEIGDVVQIFQQGGMTDFSKESRLSYGYTNSAIWLRVAVENRQNSYQTRYLGSVRPELYTFNMYQVESGQVTKVWQGGLKATGQSDQALGRLPYFSVSLPPNSSQVFYFEIRSKLSLTLVLKSLSPVEYVSSYQVADVTHFFYFGTVMSLVMYSLFFFFALKDKNFLIYAMFGISVILADYIYSGFLELNGISFLLVNSHSDSLIFLALAAALAVIYAISFLEIKQVSQTLFKFGLGLAIFCLIVTLLACINQGPIVGVLVQATQMISMVFSFSAGCYMWSHGHKAAKIYVLGWGIFSVTVVVWFMGNLGIIEKSYIVGFAPIFGTIAEMSFRAIALSLQFHEMQKDQFEKEIAINESDSLRSLVQVVCHDIANPLSIIAGSYTLAVRSEDIVRHLKCWERVNRASDVITAIIKQVRRMQAIKDGKEKLELKPTSIKKVFDDVNFMLKDRAESKGIQLQMEAAEDLEVIADETSLAHDVICNFVTNSIKFSEKGSTILLTAQKKDGVGVIKIRDHGIGMPPDILKNIFSSTKMTSRRGTDQEAGTGFGMPLAKSFVDAYGAVISITSIEKSENPEDHGTTVIISFPKRKDDTDKLS